MYIFVIMKHFKTLLIVILIILLLFILNLFYKKNIENSLKESIYLKELEKSNIKLKNKSDSIVNYINKLEHKDTLIKYKYQTKYKIIYKSSKEKLMSSIKDDLKISKDSSLVDSTSLIKIDKVILQLDECNELLNNSLDISNSKDSLLNIKDTIISNQDSIIIDYKYKNKKLKNKNTILKIGASLAIIFESILLIKK